MSRIFLLVALPLLLAAPALADVKSELAGIEKQLNVCIDKDQSNAGMIACTEAAQGAADKVLNRVYKSFADRLKEKSSIGLDEDNKETLKRLVASERAWIGYRDADCSLQGTQMLGGSGEGLVIAQCLYGKTRDRAKALDELRNGN